MFQAEQVKTLNDLEMLTFDYVVKSEDRVKTMTIRELAGTVHVSTSTIIRMANKLGFDGWSELKFYLKNDLSRTPEEQHYDNMLEFNIFLRRMGQPDYQKKLNDAAHMIADSRYTIFLGVGTSGSLGSYGTKYFTNIGLKSFAITDPYLAIQVYGEDVIAITLSESGKTEQVLNKAVELKNAGAKMISITNKEDTPIARLADLRLSYNLVDEWSKLYPLGNLTTQLPSLAIIETLAHKAISLYSEKESQSHDAK